MRSESIPRHDEGWLDALNTPELESYQRTLLGRFDARVLNTRPARVILGVLLAAALVAPAVQSVLMIREIKETPWRAGGDRHRTALGRWIPTAELVVDEHAKGYPYGFGHWFPTPPMVLIALVPLSKLGYVGAGIVWAFLKIVGFVAAMGLLVKGLGREVFAVPLGVLLATAVFSFRPILSDLQHGNLNIFMMIWLALAWVLYVRGRDFSAGLLVALAIVTKLTPALVLVYFVYKRSWRVCLGAGVGIVCLFVIVPGLLLGFERNFEYLHTWFEMLVAPYAIHGYATKSITNQSLIGVAMRLLSNAGILSIEHMPDAMVERTGMDWMVRPATWLGHLLKPAITLSVVGALAWLCRGKDAARRDPRRLLEFGLVLLAMLLLSERTWKHHATTLPIVYLGVWYALTCVDWSDRFRAWFVAGLGVQFALLVGSTQGLMGDRLANLMLDGGVFCWGLLLCFVQTGILLAALNRRTHSLKS
ncbi:MAG: glycosyltransferase family 87 protein [Phycisphaerae bacterium]